MPKDPSQGGGNAEQGGADAGKDAAEKGMKAAKKAAEVGKDAAEIGGKLAASGGTDVTSWWKLARKYGAPIVGFLMILSLIGAAMVFVVIIGVVSAVTKNNETAGCASGAADLAVLATNGPVNVGDKFADPRGGVRTITQEMMGNAQAIVRAGLDFKPNPMPTSAMVIAIGASLMEAGLINNPGGHADSAGLFQQQAKFYVPKGGPDERNDPIWAATAFYKELQKQKGWESMSLGLAADKTQRPLARSERLYQSYMPTAAGLVTSILDAFNNKTSTLVSKNSESSSQPVFAALSLLNVNQRLGQSTGPAVPEAPANPNADPSADGTATGTSSECAMGDAAGGAFGDASGATGFEPGPNGVQVPIATVAGIGKINATIAVQVTNMLAKARAEGVNLSGSSYRSHQRQIELRISHCGSSQHAIWQMRSSSCSPPTAVPGRSQHELGLAIDFSNCGRSSACFGWLSRNAAAFGLKNLPSESWHWSTTGR